MTCVVTPTKNCSETVIQIKSQERKKIKSNLIRFSIKHGSVVNYCMRHIILQETMKLHGQIYIAM